MTTHVVLLLDPAGRTLVVRTKNLRRLLRRRTLPPYSTGAGWKLLDAIAFPTPGAGADFRRRCGRPGSSVRRVWRFSRMGRACRLFPAIDVADWRPDARLLPLFADFAAWRLAEPVKTQPFRRLTPAWRAPLRARTPEPVPA